MAGSTSKGSASSKKIIDAIREATGASDEDIQMVLKECNGDVNEATARLIDSTWLFYFECVSFRSSLHRRLRSVSGLGTAFVLPVYG